MRKIKLSLDGLAVESFATVAVSDARRGTVQAFVTRPRDTCTFEWNPTYAPTCANSCESCAGSCAATCDATCAYTCDDPSCATCLTYCAQLSCVEHCP